MQRVIKLEARTEWDDAQIFENANSQIWRWNDKSFEYSVVTLYSNSDYVICPELSLIFIVVFLGGGRCEIFPCSAIAHLRNS